MKRFWICVCGERSCPECRAQKVQRIRNPLANLTRGRKAGAMKDRRMRREKDRERRELREEGE